MQVTMVKLRISVRPFAGAALFLMAACSSPDSSAQADSVRVNVKPDPIYIERSESGQHVNFDFVVENLTGRDLLLTSIELSAFDSAGRILRRDFVDRFSRSSLEIAGRSELKRNEPSLVYNPFHTFAASLPIRKLRYELAFGTKNGKVRHGAVVEVVPVSYETKTELVLPLKGRLLVWDGHDYNAHHRRTNYTLPGFRDMGWTGNFQRYGYDFVLVNEQGVMYRGAPKNREDWFDDKVKDDNDLYFAFGQPVHAAGAGRVVATHDGEPDDGTIDWKALSKRDIKITGNYVVIDHLNGEFSWFGHLKQGSVRVKPGQVVQQGEVVGAVGSSGDSLFPHLHYELRTGPGDKGVEGLPSYFSGFRRVLRSGLVTAERGQVNSGDIVENP